MYFITVFTKFEKVDEFDWDFGDTQMIGYFYTLSQAQKIVTQNICDICKNTYEYAIIQEVEEDALYPTVINQELYQAKNMTTEDDRYNPNLTYEQIKIPQYLNDCVQIFI